MRKVIKKLIGLFALIVTVTLIGVSTKVNATAHDYGTYSVSQTLSSNDTATWNFTALGLSSNEYIGSGDSCLGIINTATNSNSRLTLKGSENNLTVPKDQTSGADPAVMYIPVPSASAGTITVIGSSSNSARTITFYAAGVQTESTIVYNKNGSSLTYTADQITTYNGSSYLLFKSLQTNGDFKITSISIVLTTGAFESTAEYFDVTIDVNGNSVVKSVLDGEKLTYTPVEWGFDFEGYYTDSLYQNAFDASVTTITEDTTLYAKMIAWSVGTITSSYELTNALISKIENYGSVSAEYELTGTIYSLMPSTNIGSSAYITTGGAVSSTQKGVKIVAPYAGTISVLMTTGGNSARNAVLLDSSSTNVAALSGDVAWDDTAAGGYEQRTITYTVDAGTYYLGGDNSMRIYSIVFAPDTADLATLAASNSTGESTTMVGTTAVRFVGRITGVDELDIASIEATISGDSSVKKTFTTVYTAITNISGCEAADNTYYFYYTIYGVTDEYNGKTISFTYTVTFADGSTKTLATANTYTIAL